MTSRSAAQRTTDAADTLDRWLQQQRVADAPTGSPLAGPLADPAPHSCDVGAAADQAGQANGKLPAIGAPTPAEPSGTGGRPPLSPAHTDWLHHHLAVSGPAEAVTAFRAAAIGPGRLPWALDLDQMEEDLFHTLAAPRPPQRRRLSLAGARALARQLSGAAEQRHALVAAQAGSRAETQGVCGRACPFDLQALLPVPDAVLRLGPDHLDAHAWLWAHWGTTQALRHVTEHRVAVLGRHRVPRRDPATLHLSFWSADWTPWRALAQVAARWPTLRFDTRPTYGLL